MEQPRMQIPGYEIIKQIGEGGSRTAYLALREHCTDPTVVKVFRTNGVHERIADQRDRHSLEEILQAEVEILRRFSHPNIIRIFNHGNVDDSFFIEEEYMAGGTIEDALAELSEYKALDVFQQMTRGVRFLHNKYIK
jgi:serine/threonine-protein kinase